MFEKSVLKLWPTVVKDETGGDPSPYGVGVLKGEIFARFLGRDCTRVYRYRLYCTCSCSSIMIDDGSICMGAGLENNRDYFWGRLPLLDCTRRTASLFYACTNTRTVRRLYSVLFSVRAVTCWAVQ